MSDLRLDINILPYKDNIYAITLNDDYLAFVEFKKREADGRYITDNVYSIDDILDHDMEVIDLHDKLDNGNLRSFNLLM